MSRTINILIGVELPDWWEELAIRRYRRFASVGTEVIGSALTQEQGRTTGLADLASALAENARSAEMRGAQAHILDCFGDPCLDVLSGEIEAPVIGVGQSGMIATHAWHGTFAVLTSELATQDEIEANADRYGVRDFLIACDAIGMPAETIPFDREEAYRRLLTRGRDLAEDHVPALILGCTELAMMSERLGFHLRNEGYSVAVINPIAVAERWAEMTVVANGQG